MDVSDTNPASVEELLATLALRVLSGSAAVVALTAVFVVGILDLRPALLRRFGSGSSPGWFARFLPLPLMRSGAVASAAGCPPSFCVTAFLRAGCRRLLALRGPDTAASTSEGTGASALRALMGVKPGMMIESPRSISCEFACHTDVTVENALVSISASRCLAAVSWLTRRVGVKSMFSYDDTVCGQE